jgi:hypothetical protein
MSDFEVFLTIDETIKLRCPTCGKILFESGGAEVALGELNFHAGKHRREEGH